MSTIAELKRGQKVRVNNLDSAFDDYEGEVYDVLSVIARYPVVVKITARPNGLSFKGTVCFNAKELEILA